MGCLSNPSVRRASDRLRGLVHESPLRFDRTKGAWLKLESLQRTGSFKVRGALNAILAQAERGALRRVVAASDCHSVQRKAHRGRGVQRGEAVQFDC